MKSALAVVLFWLFLIGVFAIGAETSDVESVSVMEGDSVTLKSGVTEIQTDEGIDWRFSGSRIAKISSGSGDRWVKSDGSFKDRLQLDSQTGDLKISHIKSTDSGQYKLTISSPRGSPEMTFTLTVVPAVAAKTVTALEGDSVTLPSGLTDIQTDGVNHVKRWRFGQQKSPVAEFNTTARMFNTYDGPDGRFRDRLKVDIKTGSLIITNIRNTHSGVYQVEISSTISRHTIHHTQSFSVTISDEVKPVSVLKGDNVTLRTGFTKTQRDDEILWKFGDHDEIIACLNGTVNKTWIDASLKLQTGDLTIRNIQRDGDYKLKINTTKMILHRKYQIIMTGEMKSVSVKEGETVTLPIGTEIQKEDLIHWMFGDIDLAEFNIEKQRFYIEHGPDERFRDRLKLDRQTGSLNITNTRTTDSGDYQLNINSSRRTINRRIPVTVTGSDRGRSVLTNTHPDPASGSGLSPATVTGIVVVVVLLAAAVVILAGVVIYYRRKISELEKQREENGGEHKKPETEERLNSSSL